MKKQNNAFSLIELSVVILVVGILIAGVIQGSRMVAAAKLQTARSLTKSSPVAGIKDLVLWLETTSKDSFLDSQTIDGTQLTRWNDINPQTRSPYFTLKTASDSAKYVEKSTIGGLPSIYLDHSVTQNFFLSTSSSSVVNTPVPIQDAFSYFVVSKSNFLWTGWAIVFTNGNGSSDGFDYAISSNRQRGLDMWGSLDSIGSILVSYSPEIVSYTFAGGAAGVQKIYSNGINNTLSRPTSTLVSPTTRFVIGALNDSHSYPWSGWLSEIIIFNRKLTDEECKAVEKYLGQKYGIVVS